MGKNRIWVAGGVLIVIVVFALGGLLGIKPQLDAAQVSNNDRFSVEAANEQHRLEIVALEEQSTRLPEFQAAVAELREAIPALPDLDSFSGQLAGLEVSTGVRVTGFTPQPATLFVPSVAASAVTPATVVGSSFAKSEFTLNAVGTREQSLAFVKGLQSGDRLVLVSDVTMSAADAGITTVTVTGSVYFLLDTPYVDPNAAPVEVPAADALASE